MNNVTADQVREAMTAAGLSEVNHHDCGICHYMTRFVRDGNLLFFDAGCNCSGGSGLEPREWSDAAAWINMQTRPDVKAKLAADFGIKEPK